MNMAWSNGKAMEAFISGILGIIFVQPRSLLMDQAFAGSLKS